MTFFIKNVYTIFDRATTLIQSVIEYIAGLLQSIEGIENVYEALPKAATMPDLRTFFSGGTTLQAWEVSERSALEHLESSGNTIEYESLIEIRGWLKYSDTTTKRQMQAWIDAIKIAFNRDMRLGKTVVARGPLRLIQNDAAYFYQTLVHHCVFQVPVEIVVQAFS